MPLSWCSPRLSNVMPEPATRSTTVRDTSTSPASASACTRAGRVNRDAADVRVAQLDLTGVQPDPDLDPEAPRAIAYRTRAADGAGGAVEGCDEAVTCRLDLATTESLQLGSHHGVVVIEASPPRAITEVGRLGSGVDDVGEKDCCKDPIEPLLDCPGAGEELPHDIERGVGITGEHGAVLAWQGDQPGVGNVGCKVLGVVVPSPVGGSLGTSPRSGR